MRKEAGPVTMVIAFAVLLSSAAIASVAMYGLLLALRVTESVSLLEPGYSHAVR